MKNKKQRTRFDKIKNINFHNDFSQWKEPSRREPSKKKRKSKKLINKRWKQIKHENVLNLIKI